MNDRAPDPPIRPLEAEVIRAQAGERAALELVVHAVQRDIHSLALRFLWHPQDAEDATQEIMIRILTGLSGFRGDSSFRTWVYRIACNTLLTLRKKRMEQRAVSWEEFGDDLAQGLADAPFDTESAVEKTLLLEEVRIGCTQALLLCLDRGHRLAYILGEILELDHREAAEVLAVSPAAFRKRLSRARASITSFMSRHCGLVNSANACRCHRRVAAAVGLGRVDPANLLFAHSAQRARAFPQLLVTIRQLEEAQRAAALYKAQHSAEPSASFATWLRQLLDEKVDPPDNSTPQNELGSIVE